MGSTSVPDATVTNPDVAAAVQILHRRKGWGRTAVTLLIAFLLALGGSVSASQQGTPAPAWFEDIVWGLAGLTVVSFIAIAFDSAQLRQLPAALRAQAAQAATKQPASPRAHHYPSRHRILWTIGWVGMLLILAVAVISVPAPVDGVAYLAGADKTTTFVPESYQTYCQYSCQTSTDGYMETPSGPVSASWPDVVPLGKPIHIREPFWRWGLGEALIDSDGTAVIAIVVCLLMEAFGVFVVFQLVRLVRNWRRHGLKQAMR